MLKLFGIGCIILVTLIAVSLSSPQIPATKEENARVTVEFLGGVPIDSSLVTVVPERDRQMIRLKENYLFPKSDLPQYDRVVYSSNGKYKVYYSFIRDIKAEYALDVFALDSANNVVWTTRTYPSIQLSNDGRHIINSAGYPAKLYFFDIKSSSEPLNELGPVPIFLSENGEDVVVADGGRISLFKSDGTRVWRKEIRNHSYYGVAISSQGTYIVSYGLLEDRSPALSFLRQDGKIIKTDTLEKVLKLRQVAMSSDDGKYTVFQASSAILFYETSSGRRLWKYDMPHTHRDEYFVGDWIRSLDVSKGGKVIAALIKPFDQENRENYILFLNEQGTKIAEFAADSIESRSGIRSEIHFTDDGRYAIFNNRDERRLFQIME